MHSAQPTRVKLVEFGEDAQDPGGYFIINGSERVIVGLEDLSYNKIIVDAEETTGTMLYKPKSIPQLWAIEQN